MRRLPVVLVILLTCCICRAQTTLGMITGSVRDESTGKPLAGAIIEYEELETGAHGRSESAPGGVYAIPLLPSGSYRLRVNTAAKTYQAREVYGVTVAVAGYVRVDFELRPLSDVWEKNRFRSFVFRNNTVVPFFGPDVDPSYVGTFEPERRVPGQLEPSISDVIDPRAIDSLPLAGRDIYAALVLQPGVAAQSSTTRSLGLSANGQRPSSSNFLLDGVEENDSLLSGPALPLAPEMVQEYRVSTNNFSAEYGRTSGYIANAVTRSAAANWHGIVYGDLNNQVLNANTFAHNAVGLPRNTLHQIESGFSAGGKIPGTRLRSWTAVDYFGSRSFSDPTVFILPTQAFASSLPDGTRARALLMNHPPVRWADSSLGEQGPVSLSQPVTLRRVTALERLDYSLTRNQNLMARFASGDLNRPDFNWSPYGQAPLSQASLGGAAALGSTWSPRIVSEVRVSFLSSARRWDLVTPDLPQITGLGNLLLPGNCCQTDRIAEGWHDRAGTTELSGNLVFNLGPHLLKVGAGNLDVRTRIGFDIPPVSSFTFLSLGDFAADNPLQFDSIVSRTALSGSVFRPANTERRYRYDQPYFFVQEDWRLSPILTVNAGVRYDRFAAPSNIGASPDVLLAPGPGATFDDQIASASVMEHRGALFSTQSANWSVRLAFSLALAPSHGTVLRGGFGTFYDRTFDNVWFSAAANDQSAVSFTSDSCPVAQFYAGGHYASLPAACPAQLGGLTLFDLTLFQPRLRSPVVQSFFLSLQQPVGRHLNLELDGLGSRGRHLITTDVVNRQTGIFPPANGLPNLDYRTNQGSSDYAALSAIALYRSGPLTFHAAYTWSHSVDNQSDPLLGEYFDLGFGNQTDRINQQYFGAFTFQGDNHSDRGNSDFDQRQNLVGWMSAALPSPQRRALKPLLSNWSASAVFAVRAGLPYSVYAGFTNCVPVCNTRANLIDPSQLYEHAPYAGGVQLLNPASLTVPINGQNGNVGRNALVGPGFENLDISVSRSFEIRGLSEQSRLTVRADLFNVLNHVNLQNPEAYLGYRNNDGSTSVNPDFGIALYGRAAVNSGFPLSTPLGESAREVHLLIRLQF